MSRDLKQIFDLAELRRAWGDPSAQPAALETEKSALPPAPPPPFEGAPLRILEKLEEAIGQEFNSEAAPLFRPTVEAIRALLDVATGHGLDAARHDKLLVHFDELEDLLDSLILAAAQ
jgi:hypothetical protein